MTETHIEGFGSRFDLETERQTTFGCSTKKIQASYRFFLPKNERDASHTTGLVQDVRRKTRTKHEKKKRRKTQPARSLVQTPLEIQEKSQDKAQRTLLLLLLSRLRRSSPPTHKTFRGEKKKTPQGHRTVCDGCIAHPLRPVWYADFSTTGRV